MKTAILLSILISFTFATQDVDIVKINRDISSITTQDSGQKIEIKRVQDVNNRLTDDFTKTSRACPPFCIQPTKVDPNIDTIAELEVFKFMKNQIIQHKGVLIDARLKSWFELETIPSSINMPYLVLVNSNKKKIAKIFQILGMKIDKSGHWNFDNAKELTIFDNGVWCAQATHLIKTLVKYKYPTSKIHYYRSGLQGWKLLGLTTVIHKEIRKD